MTLATSLAYTTLQITELGAIIGIAISPRYIKTWGTRIMGSMKDALGDTSYDSYVAPVQTISGTTARDAALSQVKQTNDQWFSDAMAVVAALPSNFEGLGEDVRFVVIEKVGPPNKPNAWGSLISHAIKRKHLAETGEWRKMKDVASHARRSMVLRKASIRG